MLKKIIFTLVLGILLQQNFLLLAMDEDDVTVRIWRPNNQRYGHVSLQTSEYYMSLWPRNGKNITPSPGALMTCLDADIIAEDKDHPDIAYVLNSRSLDCDVCVSKINNKFEEVLRFNEVSLESWKDQYQKNLRYSRWAPAGIFEEDQTHYLKSNFYELPQSCVTFSWNLLDSGITKPDSIFDSIKYVLNFIPQQKRPRPVRVDRFERFLENCLREKTWH